MQPTKQQLRIKASKQIDQSTEQMKQTPQDTASKPRIFLGEQTYKVDHMRSTRPTKAINPEPPRFTPIHPSVTR